MKVSEPELTELADNHTSKPKLHLPAGSFQTSSVLKAHTVQSLAVEAACWGQ